MKFKTRMLGKLEQFLRRYLYYTPYYIRHVELTPDYPEIYNKYGERMSVFFLADREFAQAVYGPADPRYILWDRYNFGLKTHFYSHFEAFNTVGKPDRKFAMLVESRAITPQSYEKFIRNRKYIENEFDAVFTFDEEILGTFSNAKFVPFAAGYWYGEMDRENYKHKNKNISILASNKNSAELHKIRKQLALKCKKENLADTFGTFDGGPYATLEDTLKNYRFSIVVENDMRELYFTEKITNCFAAQVIPVYLGAQRISEFFNADGIIQISLNDVDNIEKILAQCTPEEYERRLPAVLDNFERVKKYENFSDYIYEKYFLGKE